LNIICDEIQKLKVEIRNRIKSYQSSTTKWVQQIKLDRDHLITSIEKQQPSGKPAGTTDPWLNERLLTFQMQEMIDKENQFQKRIYFILQDMMKFDHFVICELKRIFEKYSLDQAVHSTAVSTQFASSRSALVCIDSSKPFEAFAQETALMASSLWCKDRVLEDFPFHLKETEIIKRGYLYRPATFTKWKLSYFVLTATGFLHCFDGNFRKLNRDLGNDFKTFESRLSLNFRYSRYLFL
jgi:hypothetical protein